MSAQYADLTKWIQTLEAAADDKDLAEPVLDDVADEVFMNQAAYVPVDTGKLRNTLHIESKPGERFIGPDHNVAPHDVFVEEGTRPHVIEAKPGKVLAFTINGKKVFTKRVQHPGTRPQPFAEMSLERWHESLGDKMQDVAVRKLVDGQ